MKTASIQYQQDYNLTAAQRSFIHKMEADGWHGVINDQWPEDGCIQIIAWHDERQVNPDGDEFLVPA